MVARMWQWLAALGKRYARSLSLSITILAAVGIWLLYYPGVIGPDGMCQCRQAVSGEFSSYHPPAMAGVLWLVLRCGGDIGLLMLVQCLAGVLGVRLLMLSVADCLCERRTAASYWLGTLLTLILLSPLTPTAVYWMEFLKDSWIAIALIYVIAWALQVYRRATQWARWQFAAGVVVLTVMMILTALPRHNAPIVSPAFGALLVLILKRRGVAWSYLVLPVPLAGMLLVTFDLNYLMNAHGRPQDWKGEELIGFYLVYPQYHDEIPFTYSCLYEEDVFRMHGLRFGRATRQVQFPEIVSKRFHAAARPNPSLGLEYRRTVFNHPVAMAHIKLMAFSQLINMSVLPDAYFHEGIDVNSYGLEQTPALDDVRTAWNTLTHLTSMLPLTGLLIHHAVWFHLGLLLILFLAWRVLRGQGVPFVGDVESPRQSALLVMAILGIPTSYTLGFFLAIAEMDYRFLFPSTVLMQTLALGLLLGVWLARRRRGSRDTIV